MMIFRILCGEWIEPLWDCMRVTEKEVSSRAIKEQNIRRISGSNLGSFFMCAFAGPRSVFLDFPSGAGDGQLHGPQPLLGLVAQQLQLGRVEK
jgi:hypothetical protein